MPTQYNKYYFCTGITLLYYVGLLEIFLYIFHTHPYRTYYSTYKYLNHGKIQRTKTACNGQAVSGTSVDLIWHQLQSLPCCCCCCYRVSTQKSDLKMSPSLLYKKKKHHATTHRAEPRQPEPNRVTTNRAESSRV